MEYKIIDSSGLPLELDISSKTFEIEPNQETVMEAFIDDGGEIIDTSIIDEVYKKLEESYDDLRYEVQKGFDQSNQSKGEIGQQNSISTGGLASRIINPPYPTKCLTDLIDMDFTASRSIEVKVRDSTSRKIRIKPIGTIRPDLGESADGGLGGIHDHDDFISQEDFNRDCKKIKQFIANSNSTEDFEDTCYKSFHDRETIGWGAFEVIRSASGKIAMLNHAPGDRIRTLINYDGFVEISGVGTDGRDQYTYYQNFGDKVVVDEPDPFDPSTFDPSVPIEQKKMKQVPYNPEKHGELEIGQRGIRWNLRDKDGKEVGIEQFKNAANEILFIPKIHPRTVYYGISSNLPALGAMMANSYIRDHIIQYFEHNCVPRYAVIIKGANADKKFIKTITDFFSNEIKGNQHKTLVLAPKQGFGSKVEVEFKKIDGDRKEQDFIESQKANSQIIMTVNGLSASLLGINETSSLGSGKGLSQAENYKNRESLPAQLYAARRLNRLFKYGLGCMYAQIEYDPLDIKDAESLARIIQILLIQGVISINEARSQLGMGPITGGDIQFMRIKGMSMIKVSDIPNLESEILQVMDGQESDVIEVTGPEPTDIPRDRDEDQNQGIDN